MIDDEPYALLALRVLLEKHKDLRIVGAYTNPVEGIAQTRELLPEVVFLDIDMPQLDGLDVASSVLQQSPDTDIVFVTAYSEYALQAFEVQAIDYLLKPVEEERLIMTLGRLLRRKRRNAKSAVHIGEGKLIIRSFGGFDMGFAGGASIKWRDEKSKELFCFLLHNARRDVSKEEVLDALWQGDDPRKALRQLYNGIYYLRKALADHGIGRELLCIQGCYRLELGAVEYDRERFCALYEQKANRMEALREMEALYTGEYLGTKGYEWTVYERERLLEMYLRCGLELAGLYMQSGQPYSAVEVLKKAYRQNPLCEAVTEALLPLYREIGDKAAAARHYAAYCMELEKELGIQPAEHIKRCAAWLA